MAVSNWVNGEGKGQRANLGIKKEVEEGLHLMECDTWGLRKGRLLGVGTEASPKRSKEPAKHPFIDTPITWETSS